MMEIINAFFALICVTYVNSNQLENKYLRRRCDALEGTTCKCADSLVQWEKYEEQILGMTEGYQGHEKLICYFIEVINITKQHEEASNAQDCTQLEERYAVSLEPALFLSLQSMEALNLFLKENFKNYESHEIFATTGLSFTAKQGFFWMNDATEIHKSILPLVEQIHDTNSCYKFFLTDIKERGLILKAIECSAKISQYIRICYYAVNYIQQPKTLKLENPKFKKKRALNAKSADPVGFTVIISGRNQQNDWTGGLSHGTLVKTNGNLTNGSVKTSKCPFFAWKTESETICYVLVSEHFKRTESMHYNLVNKMCSDQFFSATPMIPARIRHREQIRKLRDAAESFLEARHIYRKRLPILSGLIHMRGMGFIWVSGNTGMQLNSLDPSYDRIYEEMPHWIDPTFHPFLNTTVIHCHRFVIWTHTNDDYAQAIPCEYPTTINLVLCEYNLGLSSNEMKLKSQADGRNTKLKYAQAKRFI